MKSENRREITIEDLLRLKRAERPPAEFWSQFDRQLRAKQLAAIVEKRPWWQRLTLPATFSLVSRYRVPLGAGAALALAFVSVREYRHAAIAPTIASAPDKTEEVAISPVVIAAAAELGRVAVEPAAVDVAPETREKALAVTTTSATAAPASAEELSQLAPLVSGRSLARETDDASPAARHIATNLAAVQNAEPVGAHSLLAVASGFEARATATRAAVEPLQQITPPGDSRRSRLLTAMVSTTSFESSFRTTERAASRIAEDRLYDQVHRFDARGDRVQVKF